MSVAIHIKESERKIKHPSDDPLRKKKEAVGRAGIHKMNFENAAERRDYEKRVKANPMNVPGRPAFYPPLELRSSLNSSHAAKKCVTPDCGGCCTFQDGFKCPRCGRDNSTEN